MITLTARVELVQGGTIGSSSLSGNKVNNEQAINVSSPISEVVGKRSVKVGNPFILGKSKLGSGAKYTEHLPYFMGRVLSNTNGNFPENYVLSVFGSNIKAVTICFNEQNGEFPNYVLVDGEKFVDDDFKWEIVFNKQVEEYSGHNITIPNWNTPNSPMIITGIFAELEIEINKANLVNLSRRISNKSDIKYPQYGVISNHGNINIIDIDETVLDLIIQQAIGENKIDLYINNTTTGLQEKIASFYTKEWSYDNDNRQVSLTIKDLLEQWQNINVDAINYVPTVSEPQPLSFAYEELYNITIANGFDMLSLDELDDTTKMLLTNTIIEYPLLESDNLWGEWDKLCQATQSHIYVDSNGIVIFKHNT